MTKTEHATFLQGLKSWHNTLGNLGLTRPINKVNAVIAAMEETIVNLEDMRYCESCKQMLPSKDMENSRYCKLCVVVMDDMDEAWTETEKDLRLVI